MRIPRSYRKLAEMGIIILLCVSTAYAAFNGVCSNNTE
jgi:hypothetical protein